MKSREIAFPIGLYEGCLICDTPSDYLEWVRNEGEVFGDEVKEAANEEYIFRTKQKAHWRSCCGAESSQKKSN